MRLIIDPSQAVFLRRDDRGAPHPHVNSASVDPLLSHRTCLSSRVSRRTTACEHRGDCVGPLITAPGQRARRAIEFDDLGGHVESASNEECRRSKSRARDLVRSLCYARRARGPRAGACEVERVPVLRMLWRRLASSARVLVNAARQRVGAQRLWAFVTGRPPPALARPVRSRLGELPEDMSHSSGLVQTPPRDAIKSGASARSR